MTKFEHYFRRTDAAESKELRECIKDFTGEEVPEGLTLFIDWEGLGAHEDAYEYQAEMAKIVRKSAPGARMYNLEENVVVGIQM